MISKPKTNIIQDVIVEVVALLTEDQDLITMTQLCRNKPALPPKKKSKRRGKRRRIPKGQLLKEEISEKLLKLSTSR